MSFVNSDIGSTYSEAGKYKLAHEAFDRSLYYAKQARHTETIMENYGYLAELYGKEKNYEQKSVFLEKYYILKDSLFNSDNKSKLTELESDYQIEKKNATLAKQESENVKSKNQRNIFLAVALAALLLVATLGVFYKRIQLKNIQISKQKEDLQQLNHVKDRLFAILSHDLRNPLVTLKTYLSLSSNPNLSLEKKEKYKEQTNQAVSQTSNLLDNLLVWANLQLKNSKPAISQVDLNDCIDDAIGAVAAQAQQKQIEIIKKVEIFTASSNQGILELALRNLITNAIKYSNEGSKITIFAQNDVHFNCIGVLDNGIGMSKTKVDEILNAQVQNSVGTLGEKGNGLGLFLVIELLQKINAQLFIESQEGKGSSFMIKL